VQKGLESSIEALKRLASTDRGDSARWRGMLNTARQLQRDLHEQGDRKPDPNFPALLRAKREAAGLTQKQLAQRAGLSTELIRGIEAARNRVTAATIRALMQVPELGLDVAAMLPAPLFHEKGESLNWYVPPQLDAVSMLQELQRRLASSGGRIEQTYMYLDVQSALDWWHIANDPQYLTSHRHPLPAEEVAALAMQLIGRQPVDVVALGPGDGQTETRLVQALISHQAERDLRYYLLDISQPLLSKAFRHAQDMLHTLRNVFVVGMFGNFHYLPLYEQIFYKSAGRRRLFTLLGVTLNNLEDEGRFFQDSLRIAHKDDLLVVDFTIAFAPASDPKRIRELDVALGSPMPEAVVKWLGGPFLRNAIRRPLSVSGQYELCSECLVPGSYSLDAKLRVHDADGAHRNFVVMRAKRYDPDQLAAWFAALGWRCELFKRFGPSTRNQMGLMLLRKM
jgi:transcriptional regulator with XRE-family HTH domain